MKLQTKDDYAQVIDTYGNLVYRLCFVYLKNKPDVDDAYQDIFLKLMEKKPVFENDEHLKAWLIKVATNHCKNMLRFQMFHRNEEVTEDIPDRQTPSDSMLSRVMALPLKYRNVIYLHYYEGYKTKEIALMLKKNEATIRTNLMRAKDALRKEMEKEEDNGRF